MTQKVNYDKKRADALRAMHEARVKAAKEAEKQAKKDAEAAANQEGELVQVALAREAGIPVVESADAEQKAA